MPPPANAAAVDGGPRPSRSLWIAAAVEIGVAVAVSAIVLHAGHAPPATDGSASGMASMHSHRSVEPHWSAGTLVAAALAAAMLAWWLATRARIPAVLTAAGLVWLGASDTVRSLAVHSHLVAMAALEALLVAVPLLLIASLPRRAPDTGARRSLAWTVWVVVAVILNSALLIALHLPAVHNRGADLDMLPLWLALLIVVVGLAYWGAILLTTRGVRPALRRGALIVGQEVAAILGLATLIGPNPHMNHAGALGLSANLDQRLGGMLMLVTCAAVTLPLANRLERQQLRTEPNVH